MSKQRQPRLPHVTPADASGGAPESRSAARARTAQLHAEQAERAQRAKRVRRTVQVLGALVITGLLVAIVLAVLDARGSDEESPERAVSGEVVAPSGVQEGAIPVGDPAAPVSVDLYFDYMCPACGAFEELNGDDLTELLDAGTIRVDLHVMNFLDPQSEGTAYSTRAGNSVATVADQAPDQVWALHRALYAEQPGEGTPGLDDDEIAEIARGVGVPDEVVESFTDGTHSAWVAQSNELAFAAGVQSTPTILIDGEPFTGDWSVEGALVEAIEDAEAPQ